MKQQELKNNRVVLEPMNWDHFEALVPISRNHPDLLKYSPSQFGSEEYLKEYIKKALQFRDMGTQLPFVIFDKPSKTVAGSTRYMNIDTANSRLEIGSTWIAPQFQRTGLNRNCKFLLLQHAFEVLKFERVEFKTDSRNEQSKMAIEAIGGIYEGRLRSHTLMPDGFRRDTVYFSILKDEWPKLKSTVFKSIAK